MNELTICINTYNDIQNLYKTLESVKWADKIIIVDAGSNDGSVDLERRYTDDITVINRISYYDSKKILIDKVNTKWVLFLDSDEYLTKELSEEIKHLINLEYNGFRLKQRKRVLNSYIDTTGDKCKLFKKNKARLKKKPVHEGFVVKGRIGTSKHCYIHNNCVSVSKHLDKLNKYTDLELKNDIPFSMYRLLINPIKYFLWVYIKKRYIKYGVSGFYYSMMKGVYKFVEEAKRYENKKNTR